MSFGSEFNPSFHNLPGRSHYAGGENDPRVTAVLLFAAGMAHAHGYMPPVILFDRIAHLHDRKGWLYVRCWRPLGADVENCLREAWQEIGNEPCENVSFVPPDDAEWQRVWNARRWTGMTVVKS